MSIILTKHDLVCQANLIIKLTTIVVSGLLASEKVMVSVLLPGVRSDMENMKVGKSPVCIRVDNIQTLDDMYVAMLFYQIYGVTYILHQEPLDLSQVHSRPHELGSYPQWLHIRQRQ